MSSYRWQVLQEILRALKEDVKFNPEPGDGCNGINPNAIVFRKVSARVRPINHKFTFEQAFPGIIVSTPFSEPFDFERGTNNQDEYVYHFLIQICDSDNYEPEANVQSYWAWQEQVMRLFTGDCMSAVNSVHVLARSVNVDVVDESKWLADENFVCGVHVAVQVWMTRGIVQVGVN